MPDNDDGEDNGIDAIADALDQAKRAGEFAHWRAAKLRKRMKKRFADKEAQIQAMIVHEKEMIRKKALRRDSKLMHPNIRRRAHKLHAIFKIFIEHQRSAVFMGRKPFRQL